MSAKQVLAMRTGDKVRYAGKLAHVVDWKCNHEPTFASDGTRIDAEPTLQFSDGLRHGVHPRFWDEIEKV